MTQSVDQTASQSTESQTPSQPVQSQVQTPSQNHTESQPGVQTPSKIQTTISTHGTTPNAPQSTALGRFYASDEDTGTLISTQMDYSVIKGSDVAKEVANYKDKVQACIDFTCR